ncbi:MAG: hypothetical protein HXX17_10425 [Geobacteraceae bacterium]|nr:hypothetical protein [Geobacteraceae bacterium]
MRWDEKIVHKVVMVMIFVTGIIFSIYLCCMSDGALTHDEIGHILIAKHSWDYPRLLLDLWGRPLNTLIYLVPAKYGLLTSRLFSVGLTAIIAILTVQTARQLKIKNLLVVAVLVWAQPWFAGLSYFAITEIPFSLFLVLGILLAQYNKAVWASIVFGSLMYIRHEGIALAGLWAIYLVYKRNWRCLAITTTPAVIFNLLYLSVYHEPAFTLFSDIKPTDFYGHGGWLHFAPSLFAYVNPFVLFFAFLGWLASVRVRERLLLVVMYPVYLLLHVIIFRFGLFASGGYGFFLLPLAPGIALFAAIGFEWLLKFLQRIFNADNRTARFIGWAATCAVFVVTIGYGGASRPYPADYTSIAAMEASDWLKKYPYKGSRVVSTFVWFHYYFDLPWQEGKDWTEVVELSKLPVGTIAVWDAQYSERWGIHKASLDDANNGWVPLSSFQDGFIQVYQKHY